jgi:hypothetical protein
MAFGTPHGLEIQTSMGTTGIACIQAQDVSTMPVPSRCRIRSSGFWQRLSRTEMLRALRTLIRDFPDRAFLNSQRGALQITSSCSKVDPMDAHIPLTQPQLMLGLSLQE